MNNLDPGGRELWQEPEHLPVLVSGAGQPEPLVSANLIRGVIVRQGWLIAAIVLLALVGGVIATMITTPIYQASTTLRVEPNNIYSAAGRDFRGYLTPSQVEEFRQTQAAVVQSWSLAEVVAADLDPATVDELLGSETEASRPAGLNDEQWVEQKSEIVTETLQKGVMVTIPFDTSLMTISYQSMDADLAAKVANAYADAFLKVELRNELSANEYGQEFYEDKITEVRAQLEQAEQDVNIYARANGLVAQESYAAGDAGYIVYTTTGAKLAEINNAVSTARAERIKAEQEWREVQGVPPSQLPQVQTNPIVQELVVERRGLESQLTELRQRYNDQFPQIVEVNEQIAGLDGQINQIGEDIKSSVRNAYQIALRQEQALEGELSNVTAATLDEQDKQVEYEVLEREAQALRDQLASLLQGLNSVTSASDFESGTIRKLDAARVPMTPVSPSLFKNLAIALVLGFAIAFGLALARELIDNRLRSLDDIEAKLALPALGRTPYVDSESQMVDDDERYGSLMESYASIRTAIEFALPRDRNVIQMTSSRESEGKSTTAVILAELYARVGRKTLLIDADLRRPSIASILEVPDRRMGLTEVLLDQVSLEEAVHRNTNEGLDVLSVGSLPANPPDLLSSRAFRNFLEVCRSEYSLIIIDSPPVLGIADSPILAGMVDATIFVVEANVATSAQVNAAVKRIRSGGGYVMGAVLTKYRALKAGEGYGQEYEYYRYGT